MSTEHYEFPETPKKKSPALWIILGVAAVLILCCCITVVLVTGLLVPAGGYDQLFYNFLALASMV